MVVVLLGPDGCGKSSVIKQIIVDLAHVFSITYLMHLRPKLGFSKGNDRPVTNPHCLPLRSKFASWAKLVYFLIDYNLGYLLKVMPIKRNGALVVFDRYYHDLLVDPKRYRYGGPMWLARWVSKLIPKPDLFILLDTPPEVLHSRKQEVPFEETARQREAYLELVGGMKNGEVVDASKPLNEVVAYVNKVILDFMAERTRKRLGF